MPEKWSIEREAKFVLDHFPSCPCGKLKCDKCSEICTTVEPAECRIITRAKNVIMDLLKERNLKNAEEGN